MKTLKRKGDTQAGRIYRALKSAFPNLSEEESDVVRERNRYTVCVRVVDDSFAEMTFPSRHAAVKKALSKLDPEDRENISLLIMLSPEEANDPDMMMESEFDEPIRSRS
jgi:stress-induced morphogen